MITYENINAADLKAYFSAELVRLGNLAGDALNEARRTAEADAGFAIDEHGHSRPPSESVTADHGLVDAKGRKVGGFVFIRAMVKAQTVEIPHPLSGRYVGRLATVGFTLAGYETTVRATRDGKGFGAWPQGKMHATLEAARAAAPKLLAAQGKRYAKKFGGAA